jgi:hypothetical protein
VEGLFSEVRVQHYAYPRYATGGTEEGAQRVSWWRRMFSG